MSDYCICAKCGCKHLVWESSCPYCRRIAELEEEISQLRYERAQAGKRAMEAETKLETAVAIGIGLGEENKELQEELKQAGMHALQAYKEGMAYNEVINRMQEFAAVVDKYE